MNTTRIRIIAGILLLMFCGLVVTSVDAQQEEEVPLIRLLGQIPNTTAISESFSYVDYRAAVEARPGAPLITTTEDWQALVDQDADELGLWMAAVQGVTSGFAEFSMTLRDPLATRNLIGIDPLTIERAVVYGVPPAQVTLVEGDFDEEAIAEAFAARDYQEITVDGVPLLCANPECDGSRMDRSAIQPADPFGGRLGRPQPLFVTDNLVVTSTDAAGVVAQAQAILGEERTLAESENYRSVAEAITRDGQLRQAWFINPFGISPASASILPSLLFESEVSPSAIATLQAQLEAKFTPLPQYQLLALADIATESEQIATVALVYHDADAASDAGEILIKSIQNYVSVTSQQPMLEMLDERQMTNMDTDIYENDERAVLLLRLHSPIPSAEESLGDMPISSSLIFSLLTNMYFSRDTGWLATTF